MQKVPIWIPVEQISIALAEAAIQGCSEKTWSQGQWCRPFIVRKYFLSCKFPPNVSKIFR